MKTYAFNSGHTIWERSFCLFVCLFAYLHSALPADAQNHWLPEHPFPAANDFTGSWVFENNDVLLTGGAGIICYYTASTDSWEYHWLSDNEAVDHLKKIQMLDDQTGYAIGFRDWDFAILYRTDDRGITWTNVTNCPLDNVLDLFFTSVDSGFTTGAYTVFRTLDGSETWTTVFTDSTVGIIDIYFMDDEYGWLASLMQHTIYQTINYGESWTMLERPIQQLQPEHVRFFTRDRGIIQGLFANLQTNDGGETWDYLEFDENYFMLDELVVASDTFVFGATSYNYYLRSFDNGQSWEFINDYYTNFDDRHTQTLHSNSSGKVVLAGEGGYRCYSDDFGTHFQPDSGLTKQYLEVFEIQDTGRLWISGGYDVVLTRTLDESEWEIYEGLSEREGLWIYDISFRNEYEGWICANTSSLLRTTDSGENWENVNIGLEENDHPLEVIFRNDQNYMAISTSGYIVESTNAGESWSIINETAPSSGFQKPNEYVDSQNLWMGRDNLYFSNDGGYSWDLKYTCEEGYQVYDICFLTPQTGYIVVSHRMHNGEEWCGSSYILKTIDGGDTWRCNHYGDLGSPIYSIDFYDEAHGMAVGGDGHSYTTNDGGYSWIYQNTGTSNILKKVTCLDSVTYFAIGNNGTIYKYEYDYDCYVDTETSRQLPDELSISAYPNPFNHSVNISFYLKNDANFYVNIYNINGQLIYSGSYGHVNKGKNTYRWDGRNNNGDMVSSGVYIICAMTDDCSIYRKIMLIK